MGPHTVDIIFISVVTTPSPQLYPAQLPSTLAAATVAFGLGFRAYQVENELKGSPYHQYNKKSDVWLNRNYYIALLAVLDFTNGEGVVRVIQTYLGKGDMATR